MAANWHPAGYTRPHRGEYEWQWLWDSCLHALVWNRLGDPERARLELRRALHHQDPLGFVPHMIYDPAPSVHAAFWGRSGTSSITQPPMYGHAAAALERSGVGLDPELLERCRRGLWFLLRERRRLPSGLIQLCHPWESGADNSPRWDGWCPGGFDVARWYDMKGMLLRSVERSPEGSPVGNDAFPVAGAGWNALIAFNAAELAPLVADDEMAAAATELAGALDRRWDPVLRTWTDDGGAADGSHVARTLDALLPLLVCDRPEAMAQLLDPTAFGAPYGPAGVHRGEPAFDPVAYWRGPSWPPLDYLLWLAARRLGEKGVADAVANRLVAGALRSGLSEYWHPDTGEGLGARPQSWAGVAHLVAEA